MIFVNESKVGDDFYNALHVQLEQVDLQEALSPLLSNPRIKKYVEPLTMEEELQIKEEANQLLLQLLKGSGGDSL